MKSKILISAIATASTELDKDGLPAANSRILEGKMSIPYGLWPVTIKIKGDDGQMKDTRVLQRLDKTVAARLVSAFNSLRGRLSRFVSGMPIYLDHPDYKSAKNVADWAVQGKCTAVEAGESSLIVQGDFNDAGKALVAANAKLAPSPHWGLAMTGENKDGLAICEPLALYSIGLTPFPNILGAAVNEDPTAADQADEQTTATLMSQAEYDKCMAILASDIADLEQRLADAMSGCESRDQQIAALNQAIADLTSKNANQETCLVSLRAELDATRKALENEKSCAIESAMNSVLDGAVAGGRLLAADRDVWKVKLVKTPSAMNELFDVAQMKTVSTVGAERLSAANAAMGGTNPAHVFEQAVRTRMAATHEPWPVAWDACKASHAEVFKLMPNGGRA